MTLAIRQNWLDRAIGFVDPVRQARRVRARAFLAMSGAYIGASRSRRQTKSWLTSSGDADSDTLYDVQDLRERSRDLIRNDCIGCGAVNVTVSNVIGSGLKLQARIDRDVIAMSDEQADAWEASTEREFRLWCESQDCDTARTLNFYDHQNLAFRSCLENGDVFYALPRRSRPRVTYDLRLMAIEADRVLNKDRAPDVPGLVAGVQKDSDGAPTHYHVLNGNPFEPYVAGRESWAILPAFGSRTGLRLVLHLYPMLRVGQTRGVPFLAPVIEPLKVLGKYTEYELMAAAVSGAFTVFLETEGGNLDFDVSGLGQETGAETTDTDIKMAGGEVVGLNPGEKATFANPTRPNTSFDPFVLAILRQVGTALEIPFEVLIRHFSSSYSASRAALLEAWRFFRRRRTWVASNFCQPIYENWLWDAVSMGRVPAPGFYADPLIRKAYSGALWIGDAPGYVDPATDVDAATKRVDGFLSTLDEETALLGGDFEKNWPRIVKERAALKKAGLWLPPQPKLPAPQQGQPPAGGQE